ncbi:TetR/AcrR family transcriptional regulator [Mycolicibacter arupensis]|jgi:AcrR family transcriptional regulator|uniref:TetR/AcrR family transcriptional regulator n=1 Tax=Mycolicibacter arupensis TaxID=342002 RepID=A0A5B1MLQ6_9MYCO|nr:TetR/AcrR family transcriptional regulator [Mycolicibacter arupensis]KAA1432917.1 TetR/AcrR family transcriptional regulator [Mycolicibacter arupensis]TXI55951.1 MAG: TetR/AcrR family transcriptional regulator [Mycolicibacter arupensis]
MTASPPVKRKPRSERRSDSRALILAAAVQALVKHGYAGATTVVIQQLAGVSRGRLLHYFPSRDELLIAAAQHLAVERIGEMEQWFATAPLDGAAGAQRIDYAVLRLWRTFRQPYFWAAMELWMAARTNSALRGELVDAERRLGRAIEHVIATMFGPVHSSHPGFADLRELLFTSMRGVAMTYSIDDRDADRDPHLAMWRAHARRTLTGEIGGQS